MLRSLFDDYVSVFTASVRSLRTTCTLLLAVLLTTAMGINLTGCASAVEAGFNSAGNVVGNAVGRAVGLQLASAANLPPPGTVRWNQYMASQAQILFSASFSAGGMWPAGATYEPGGWTEYRLQNDEGESALQTLERARMKTTDDGNQWWRVRGVQNGEDWVYEGLLDPEKQQFVRLRAKDPEGTISEVPITEETIYQPPQRLTEESVEGATVGTESVDTPAGTFEVRRVEYGRPGSSGTITWLLSDDVPGHVVQYQIEGDGSTQTSTLTDYGTDATTELDSY